VGECRFDDCAGLIQDDRVPSFEFEFPKRANKRPLTLTDSVVHEEFAFPPYEENGRLDARFERRTDHVDTLQDAAIPVQCCSQRAGLREDGEIFPLQRRRKLGVAHGRHSVEGKHRLCESRHVEDLDVARHIVLHAFDPCRGMRE